MKMLLGLILLLPLACFASREEAKQADDVSGFMFTGNIENAYLTVMKDSQAVWQDLALREDERLVIKPGVYEVIVKRDGSTVVYRRIFLDSGNIMEIHVP
jgi:hypothetical protein